MSVHTALTGEARRAIRPYYGPTRRTTAGENKGSTA